MRSAGAKPWQNSKVKAQRYAKHLGFVGFIQLLPICRPSVGEARGAGASHPIHERPQGERKKMNTLIADPP
eukprot:Skav228263  [mRNA]  locus=scaffold3031:196974:197186:- [translate_table: standard]